MFGIIKINTRNTSSQVRSIIDKLDIFKEKDQEKKRQATRLN